jgi:GntR family transcriptional regulator/GntR family frlABCD operon transcriptional regulator
MSHKRYQQIYHALKSGIQQGSYVVGSYLPSENDLCTSYSITRTTARRALDELLKEGFIEKEHGKGSRVKERRQSLGLLTVKGFSEAVGENVNTTFLQKPHITSWPAQLPFQPSKKERTTDCIYFERLRGVGDVPVMLECNWFSAKALHGFVEEEFVDGSFFKTLSSKYLIEITGSEQELRALFADEKTANLLKIGQGAPILQISIRFTTGNRDLNIYSYLYCNTDKYPIGNIYRH